MVSEKLLWGSRDARGTTSDVLSLVVITACVSDAGMLYGVIDDLFA